MILVIWYVAIIGWIIAMIRTIPPSRQTSKLNKEAEKRVAKIEAHANQLTPENVQTIDDLLEHKQQFEFLVTSYQAIEDQIYMSLREAERRIKISFYWLAFLWLAVITRLVFA